MDMNRSCIMTDLEKFGQMYPNIRSMWQGTPAAAPEPGMHHQGSSPELTTYRDRTDPHCMLAPQGRLETKMWHEDRSVSHLCPPRNSERRSSRPILGAHNLAEDKVPVTSDHHLQPVMHPIKYGQLMAKDRIYSSQRRKDEKLCTFCLKNKETIELCRTHVVKDTWNRVICPVLRSYICEQCNATGDNAHTRKYCPLNRKAS